MSSTCTDISAIILSENSLLYIHPKYFGFKFGATLSIFVVYDYVDIVSGDLRNIKIRKKF